MTEHDHYFQILHQYDEFDQWEEPAKFNYYETRNKFLYFARAVQERTGIACRVETDSLIQDASFIGQIMFPDDVLIRQEHHDYGGIIRVSNFGNMVTVTAENIFPAPLLDTIKQTMSEFEYIYIPPQILEEPYTGHGVTSIATWWIRYFDWI
jgi:hypothetical protein